MMMRGFDRFEFVSSKIIKNEHLDPKRCKMSDFESFGKVFKIIMMNMFL